MLVIGESGYFDTISMGLFFFFFHCIVLQISIKLNDISNKEQNGKKNKLVNFGPHCFMGLKKQNKKPVISQNLHLITFLFRWGEKKLF